MKLFLILPFFLSRCAVSSPYGSGLAGTNAEHIKITGNAKTGDYTFEATGLNQSDSTGKIVDGVKTITQLKILGKVSEAAIGEAGDVAGAALE